MRTKSTSGFVSAMVLSVILAGLVVAVLAVGKGSGFSLTKAWDCEKYNFTVQQNGDVYVQNGSASPEPATGVDVYINGNKVATLNAPATSANSQPIKIGTVAVPSDGVFSWRAVAQADTRCDDSGKYDRPANCNYFEIKVTQ